MLRTLLAACLALGVLALAAEAKPPDPRAESARLLGEGIELQKRGRHLEALDVFQRAHDIVPHVKIRWYRLKSYQALGRIRDARRVLLAIADAPELQDRRKELDELRVTFDQALGAVAVQVSAAGIEGTAAAELRIDGRPSGKLPLTLHLVPKSYLFEARLEGYEPTPVTVAIKPSRETVEIELKLTKKKPVVPKLGKPELIPKPEPKPKPGGRWLPWTLIGAGIAATLGSAGFFAKHAIDAGELDEARGDEQSPINLVLGGVTAGVGVGLIVTGALLLPDDDGGKTRKAGTGAPVGVSLWEVPGGGLVLMTGRF